MVVRSVCCLYLLGRTLAVSPSCTGAACQAAALEGAIDAPVSLLQHRGASTSGASPRKQQQPALAAMDPDSQAQRLQAVLPVAWLHVPKCGSSLNNFMIHLPGVCPGVADDVVISSETMGPHHNAEFKNTYNVLEEDGACPGGFSHWGDHAGAGPDWDSLYEGHTFVMLRQPEQRALSGYHFNYHSWPLGNRHPPADELEYAKAVQGCAVRMITRGGDGPKETCGGGLDSPPVTDAEVQLAIDRMRHSVPFVGITDQWALSMCLGHRMFGGKCRMTDFLDGRTTDTDGESKGAISRAFVSFSMKPHLYDVSPLKGFTDPYDGALYEAALEVFQDELLRYNVSEESCQPCWDEAGINVTA